jgi:hypothetical protein
MVPSHKVRADRSVARFVCCLIQFRRAATLTAISLYRSGQAKGVPSKGPRV